MHAFIAVRSTFVLETPSKDFGIVPAAPYVARQVVDVGSVIHSFIGLTSVVREDTDFGNVPAAPYVEVQLVAVGSVIHVFRVATSVDNIVHAELSHLDAKTDGKAEELL